MAWADFGRSNELFGLNASPWPTETGSVLLLSATATRFTTLAQLTGERRLEGTALLVPCGPLMDRLRARLLPEAPQAELPLTGSVAGPGGMEGGREMTPPMPGGRT